MTRSTRVVNGVTARTDGSPPQRHGEDPMLGKIIENKYRLIAKLGAGGMGSVYRAERLLIGGQIAVKILHAEHVAQPQSFAAFSSRSSGCCTIETSKCRVDRRFRQHRRRLGISGDGDGRRSNSSTNHQNLGPTHANSRSRDH